MTMKESKKEEIKSGSLFSGTSTMENDSTPDNIPNTQVEELELKLEGVEKKYMLLYADFENYKKRALKEREDLVTNTKVKMLQSILDMDNDIFYALKSGLESENIGIKLIAQKLDNFLISQGVETIQTQTYDQDLHEVISVIEGDKKGIIEVASKGYLLGGKPFRYPKIILGK